MKKATLIFLLSTGILTSQNYMDKLVEEACNCVSEIPDTVSQEDYTMELGLCLIKISIPYKKQLKKEFDIDMDNVADSGEKLGSIIGSRMIGVCPNELIAMTKKATPETEDVIEEYETEGVVVRVEDNFFITYFVKDDDGKTRKYYWMSFIDTKEDLLNNYKSLVGKKVEIDYVIEEYFDPKILDYRQFFIINKLEIEE